MACPVSAFANAGTCNPIFIQILRLRDIHFMHTLRKRYFGQVLCLQLENFHHPKSTSDIIAERHFHKMKPAHQLILRFFKSPRRDGYFMRQVLENP